MALVKYFSNLSIRSSLETFDSFIPVYFCQTSWKDCGRIVDEDVLLKGQIPAGGAGPFHNEISIHTTVRRTDVPTRDRRFHFFSPSAKFQFSSRWLNKFSPILFSWDNYNASNRDAKRSNQSRDCKEEKRKERERESRRLLNRSKIPSGRIIRSRGKDWASNVAGI